MRASVNGPVSSGDVGFLRRDHRFSDWFWDHEFKFCQRHVDRDRQRQIESFLQEEERPRTVDMKEISSSPVLTP